MAAPTVWGFTGVAGTTPPFPIEGTNLYGVDISGALTPAQFTVDPSIHVLVTATKTDAEIVAAMLAFIQKHGAGHAGAGGNGSDATPQIAASLTTTS